MFKTYDYQCNNCNYTWTHIQDGSDEKYNCKNCLKCGSKKIQRLFTVPAVHVFYSPCHPRYRRGAVNRKVIKK